MGYAKLFFVFVLFVFGMSMLLTTEPWWLLQNVNLMFHEAGHIFLIPLGNYLTALGGTLFEIGVPLFISLYFLLRQEYISASFGFWWLNSAFISVSVYASDAQERALPLITGDPNTHDWHYLLGEIGWLEYDNLVGNVFLLLAAFSLGLSFYVAWQDEDITSLRQNNTSTG